MLQSESVPQKSVLESRSGIENQNQENQNRENQKAALQQAVHATELLAAN